MPGMPAPAPADAMKLQVGAGAVHAAQSIQQMNQNEQAAGGRNQTYQNIARRTFYLDGEWWVDTTLKQGGPALKVKAFSQAYFDLLKARPDLAQYLAIGPNVQVQLTSVAVQVGAEGLEALTAEQLEEIKK
jgi:hypothetical protein